MTKNRRTVRDVRPPSDDDSESDEHAANGSSSRKASQSHIVSPTPTKVAASQA